MTIDIIPVPVWTAAGLKQANKFEVRYVNYQNGPAVADCHILADTEEVSSQLVSATPEQTAQWTDDVTFFKILAQNAGLNPAAVQFGTSSVPPTASNP